MPSQEKPMPDDSRNVEAFQACLRAPFATLGIATTNTHVTGIRFRAPSVAAKAPARNPIAFLACVQIQSYLDDPAFVFDLPLKLAGTHHRLAVWEAMQRIAPGETRTYGELARQIGSSPPPVGGACGGHPAPFLRPSPPPLPAGRRHGRLLVS